MNQQQFTMFVQSGNIENVVIFGTAGGWEIWAYGHLPAGISERIRQTRRSGAVRTWADLNRALEWIRSCGWDHRVEIDGNAG